MQVIDSILFQILLATGISWVSIESTSIKMDFLPFGSARTDPLLNPTCLSDQVHTFYGAKVTVRPETTYETIRAAPENSGNTEENMSLYWQPTVYMHEKISGVYYAASIWFGSSYYVWETGQARAFPNGFNMILTAPMKRLLRKLFAMAQVNASAPTAAPRTILSFPRMLAVRWKLNWCFPRVGTVST